MLQRYCYWLRIGYVTIHSWEEYSGYEWISRGIVSVVNRAKYAHTADRELPWSYKLTQVRFDNDTIAWQVTPDLHSVTLTSVGGIRFSNTGFISYFDFEIQRWTCAYILHNYDSMDEYFLIQM